jgi:hypothetical protein
MPSASTVGMQPSRTNKANAAFLLKTGSALSIAVMVQSGYNSTRRRIKKARMRREGPSKAPLLKRAHAWGEARGEIIVKPGTPKKSWVHVRARHQTKFKR